MTVHRGNCAVCGNGTHSENGLFRPQSPRKTGLIAHNQDGYGSNASALGMIISNGRTDSAYSNRNTDCRER